MGRGGTATVFVGTDLRHERAVAIKVLRPELTAATGHARFLREIKITAGLTHPNILPVLDSGEADGFIYFVAPFVEGESLRRRLDKEKQLTLDDAILITREVSSALSYAHSKGLVHRDIKPENILLEAGHAVVADFGIARALNVVGGERITESGIAVGTPAYMSPEQLEESCDLDGRSDLYSLGCVLFEMLAGEPPFSGPTAILRTQHLSADPPDLGLFRPTVPVEVADAIRTALAKFPADRFATGEQFDHALAAVRDRPSTKPVKVHEARASPVEAGIPRRLRRAAAFTVLLLIPWRLVLGSGCRQAALRLRRLLRRAGSECCRSGTLIKREPRVGFRADPVVHADADGTHASQRRSVMSFEDIQQARGHLSPFARATRWTSLTGEVHNNGEKRSLRTDLIDFCFDRRE
jgi:serine/threonine-protein kinase